MTDNTTNSSEADTGSGSAIALDSPDEDFNDTWRPARNGKHGHRENSGVFNPVG